MQALRIKLCFLPTNFYIPHHFGIIGGVGWDWVEVLGGGVYLRLFVSIYNGASFSHQLESHFLTKCIDTRGSFESEEGISTLTHTCLYIYIQKS